MGPFLSARSRKQIMKKVQAANDRQYCSVSQDNSNRQNPANETSDIIGKLISGEKVISGIDFSIALYQIWEYICERNRKEGGFSYAELFYNENERGN